MSNKNLVLRKDKKGESFYFYTASTFYRRDREEGPKRSNRFSLDLKIHPDLINELRHWVKLGHKVIEIRKNEIWLKDLHEKEVFEKTLEIEADFEEDGDLELKEEKTKSLLNYIQNNHFIYTKYDLFNHNLEDLSLEYNHTKKKLTIQNVKTFKNGKIETYTHQVNGNVFKQFRKMLIK